MRRRSSLPLTKPATEIKPAKPASMGTGDRTFRVSTGGGQTEMVTAAKMEVGNDGLTFKDAKGQVVGVFRGYGLSAVADDSATTQQRDCCETVKASDFF